ncbi:hypothetical protein ABTY98_13635 [Streptomyces sp. NPDC096040]|uniref:hypothetical protein n=1 Tax=Streptomyces sp. NPDC096040 TaxID=3155541 RepID=UPI00331FACE7
MDACADPEPRLREVFPRHRDCFDRVLSSWNPPTERVASPYEGDFLPGYLLGPPGADGPRPTLIAGNGSGCSRIMSSHRSPTGSAPRC